MDIELSRIEAVADSSGVAPLIGAFLPVGVRPRQLCVRTLVVGMLVCQAEGRPAHLRASLRHVSIPPLAGHLD